MSAERDQYLNGRPYSTGPNMFKDGVFEYGKDDEEAGISFAEALRAKDIPVAEGVEIEGRQVSLEELAAQGVISAEELFFSEQPVVVADAPTAIDIESVELESRLP